MSLSPDRIAYMQAHAGDDKRVGIIIANSVCIVASLAVVLLRCWARSLTDTGLGWDDTGIITSWVN